MSVASRERERIRRDSSLHETARGMAFEMMTSNRLIESAYEAARNEVKFRIRREVGMKYSDKEVGEMADIFLSDFENEQNQSNSH